jgi:hypothetical protein
LRLRGKWWHYAAIGLAWFSGLIVYLTVAGAVVRLPYKMTTANTYSLSMLRHAATRQTTTTLSDLDALGGMVGSVAENGELVALPRSPDADLRCEQRARYKAAESIKVGEVSYRAIPDYPSQPPQESRHCVGTSAYTSLTADSVAVYIPAGTGIRKLGLKVLLSGMSVVVIWEIVFWNIYYRGLMSIYARRRQQRRRRDFERHSRSVRQPEPRA